MGNILKLKIHLISSSLKSAFKGKSVLITGGTGSFGKKCVDSLLRNFSPNKVIVFSRDELKQHEMRTSGFNSDQLRYFVGDVRDRDRLYRAMNGVDIVIHAAALKQVPACEYNPMEAIHTNVLGTRNVIEAALDAGISKVLALSTDKAVNPINLYGATKLCAEKLMVQSNSYSGRVGTRFACVRYGNVVGSRGSVVPIFLAQRNSGIVTVTDERMTRFWITLDQGVRFVLECIEMMTGGEVFVPKIPSMKVVDLVSAIAPKCKMNFIGIRPGEKLHELLMSEDESRSAYDLGDRFVISPINAGWTISKKHPGKPAQEGFRYASNTNDTWLTPQQLTTLIRETTQPKATPAPAEQCQTLG